MRLPRRPARSSRYLPAVSSPTWSARSCRSSDLGVLARRPTTAHRSGEPAGVVEMRPLPVVADLHPPAHLVVVRDGIDEPLVGGFGTIEITRRDNRAMRIDRSKQGHSTRVAILVGF